MSLLILRVMRLSRSSQLSCDGSTQASGLGKGGRLASLGGTVGDAIYECHVKIVRDIQSAHASGGSASQPAVRQILRLYIFRFIFFKSLEGVVRQHQRVSGRTAYYRTLGSVRTTGPFFQGLLTIEKRLWGRFFVIHILE